MGFRRDELPGGFAELTGKPLSFVIWTTTPWTVPSNVGLALHPHLVGCRLVQR